MKRKFKLCLTFVAMLSIIFLVTSSWAADKKDKDWPCIQRKVPEISTGQMWAGPALPEDKEAWRKDGNVAKLVPILAARRTDLDKASKLIEAFAMGGEKDQRNNRLALLFSGVLYMINAERRGIMGGIERYTRKQRDLSKSIQETRVALDNALAIEKPTEENDKARREIEKKLDWQTRIHQDRERSLKFVCESPILLEQRLFAIAREIMNNLEN